VGKPGQIEVGRQRYSVGRAYARRITGNPRPMERTSEPACLARNPRGNPRPIEETSSHVGPGSRDSGLRSRR
jgi:hypothetical protein